MMKIALIGAPILEPDCTHWSGIKRGMKERGVDYRDFDCRVQSADEIVDGITAFNPDLLIYGLLDALISILPARLWAIKKKALWFAEMRDERTGSYLSHELVSPVDYIFLSNDGQKDFVENMTGKPVFYVGQAGFEGEFTQPYNYDVVFIGGHIDKGVFGQRYQLFQKIKTLVTYINEVEIADRMRIYREMPSIYSTSKICLEASQVWDVNKYASGRYFHIACNGGFSVAKRFLGCEELFPEGIGKVYFDTPEEADNLIAYYLQYPEERQEIARKGKDHALKYHTYTNRVDDIIKIVK